LTIWKYGEVIVFWKSLLPLNMTKSLLSCFLYLTTISYGLGLSPAADAIETMNKASNQPIVHAGIASADITPDFPCRLIGYGERDKEHYERVLDPIKATALALSEGPTGEPWILLSLDITILEVSVADWLRRHLADELDLDFNRIVIACSHTHSTPLAKPAELVDPKSRLSFPQLPEDAESNHRFAMLLREKATPAVAEALKNRRPAGFAHKSGRLDLGYDRRTVNAEGTVLNCWNPHEFPDHPPQPLPDPTVSLVEIDLGDSRPPIWWYSAGLHPVTLGKHSNDLSADWPGAVRSHVEGNGLAETLFCQGASGEAHPWIATESEPSGLPILGSALGSTLHLWSRSITAHKHLDALHWKHTTVNIAGHDLFLGALHLGEVCWVFSPVELFGTLSRSMRERASVPLAFATLSNGWVGYWPDRTSYEMGGYEVNVAKAFGLEAGDGEALASALLELVESFDSPPRTLKE
jgi:hypothetical protein